MMCFAKWSPSFVECGADAGSVWVWRGWSAFWAAVVLWRVPDRYEALARVYVDTQSVLKPLMQGLTVQPNVDQQVTMLSRSLISRPNVSRLVDMAGLDYQGTSKEDYVEDLMRRLQLQVANVGSGNPDSEQHLHAHLSGRGSGKSETSNRVALQDLRRIESRPVSARLGGCEGVYRRSDQDLRKKVGGG